TRCLLSSSFAFCLFTFAFSTATLARGSGLSRGIVRAFYVPNATTLYENKKVSQDDRARALRSARLRRRLARTDGRGQAHAHRRGQALRRSGQVASRAPGNSGGLRRR